jgi:rubredoxin
MSRFETFEGPAAVDPADRMECGVCWHVYDPAEGDGVNQIPPGVAWAELPEDWRCPNCDSPKSRFMRLDDAG